MAAPVMAVIAMAHPVQAQARPQGFHIPAQPLSAALLEFSRQSHELVVAAGALTADKRSHDVSGRFENEVAIRELLRGTGLLAVRNAGGGYRVTAGAPRADATPVPGAGEETPGIVVTGAQRRDQQILKVPASIAAHDKASMDRQGVRSLDDLVRLTPGLSNIATSSYGGETISIRGINSNTGASTTGIYIDNTPIQTRNYLGVVNNNYPLIFDLDRVEVLRGPQGTLFGSGSEGGAVRFVTPTPSLDRTRIYGRADVSFTQGGDPSGELGVALDTPLVQDRIGLRVSAWGRHTGGYIDRVSPTTGALLASNTNSENDMAFRAEMRIVASDRLTITPSVFYQNTRRDDIDLFWPSAGTYKSTYGMAQPDHDRFVLPVLNIDYDAGPFTVKSVTSYYDRRGERVEDYAPLSVSALTGGAMTYVPGVDFHERSNTITRQKNWSEELRLTSRDAGNARFTWVVGFFFQNSTQRYDQAEVDNIDTLIPALFPGWTTETFYGRGQLPGNVSFLEGLTYETQERAVFGDASYRITNRLKASVGLRVAHNHFSFVDNQDGPFVGTEALHYSGEQSETPVTPRFNLSYQAGAAQVYATAAKGYRIGGANPQVPTTCAGDLATLGLTAVPSTYKSDSLWSYELGAKGKLLGGKLSMAGSLFWVDWNGIQANVPLPSCGFGYNANLGKAASRGFDFQLDAKPIHGLTLSAAFGYTKATYRTDVFGAVPDGSDSAVLLARKGDDLGTPNWQSSFSGEYARDIAQNTSAYFYGAWQYSSAYHRTGSEGVNGYNPYTYRGAALNSVNLRAGVRHGSWDISAYVSNMLNSRAYTYYYRAQADQGDGGRAMTMRPRTIGLTATFRN
ncbi:TonB-dependent receptor, plug [Novosphingobium nitrogenifigens DSM 19370]|uniref:TonB-dependent receptor, plug n=2 Tax=Novosphingobium nitrogenifigens TaxID=378548 RepID=F1ZB40_9SPHN|nr:TonB-dependent receptor, plug [Novosphingobium nitrogenifigens DSM 19370]